MSDWIRVMMGPYGSVGVKPISSATARWRALRCVSVLGGGTSAVGRWTLGDAGVDAGAGVGVDVDVGWGRASGAVN